jgi:hypothetical protein
MLPPRAVGQPLVLWVHLKEIFLEESMRSMTGLWLRGTLGLGAVVVAGVGAAVPARATVVIQPSLEQMTQRSGVVVHAVVEDVTVVEGESGRILTVSRLRVKDGIKGARTGGSVTLYQVGGTLNGRVARIAGVSTFEKGEEVILFADVFQAADTIRFLQTARKTELPAATLNPSDGWVVPYGIGLGKYQVKRPDGSSPLAVEELGDVAPATVGPQGTVVGGRLVRTQQPLDIFVQEVRRMVAQGSRP